MVVINGAYRRQRITGQQRYATEMASRLLSQDSVRELLPPRPSGRARVDVGVAWAWTQAGLPVRSRTDVLLSLTSRAPVFHSRHVVTIHDLFLLTHPEWFSRAFVATHAPLLRRHLATAAAIITVSAPVADELRALTSGQPVHVAPNAASDIFTPVGPTIRQLPIGRRIPRREGFFLTVASLDPRKNIIRLLDAHRMLPAACRRAYPLVLAGGAHHSFRNVEVMADDDIVVLGYVSNDELAALYRSASAVVVPSLAEGFGLPIVEALASGAAVAASDISVFRWVADGAAQFFDPLDIEALAAALVATVAEGDAAHRPGRVRAARHFDWSSSAAEVMAALRRVEGQTRLATPLAGAGA